MSRKICCCDQCKLNQILEQVEALSDIIGELRTELNHLKKISCNVNRKDVCFESIKKNKIDYASLNVLRKVKTYFKNIDLSANVEDRMYGLTKNTQVLKRESQESTKFSTIYDNLKYFKNKIIKNIRKTRQSAKSIKNKCVTSSQKQHKVCLLREKEEQKSLKLSKRNEDTNKYIDSNEELDNLADTLFTSDASAQADIAICSRQENDEKSHNCNRLASRNTDNNEQTSLLSMISDDRSVIYLDSFADKLSKTHARQTFLKNKIKKYKKCLCKRCPYALYKLPCNKFRCSTPEKKTDDEISGLTLECLSSEEKKNFPKFVNINTMQNNRCFPDSSLIEIGIDKSLTSSLSVDLEVDVYDDYCNLENVDEFKLRKTRTYTINRTSIEKDYLIKDFRIENKPSFNTISSWRSVNEKDEKKENSNEIMKRILSQKRYVYPEESNHNKSGKLISNWSIKNNNKQIQCVIPALTTPRFNKKISVKTSTSNFQQKDIQLCRTIDEMRCNNYPEIIIPKRMKTNIEIQSDNSCLNCIQNESSTIADYTNGKNAREINIKNERKTMPRERNICDICAIEMDASLLKIIWPRMKTKYNIYSAIQTEEDINIHSNKPSSDSADWQNRIMSMRTSCPYYCNRVSNKKIKKCTALSSPIDYRRSSKGLNFDMSNVSSKLYNCLEKLDDITA